MNVDDLRVTMELLGYLVRLLGALVFGVAVGWLTMRVLKLEEQTWQIRLGAYLGLLAAFVLLGHWVAGGGAIGMFGLGAGGAILVLALMAARKTEGEEE
jgi:hypothetical protein